VERQNEKNISAKSYQKTPYPRLSQKNEDQKRQKGAEAASCQRPETPCCFGFRKIRHDFQSMLEVQKRLRHSWEFRRFFGQSQTIRLSECLVYFMKNEQDTFRLGITMKARGNSVQRNRVKREIREAFRALSPLLGKKDYNVVVPSSKKLVFPYQRMLRQALGHEFRQALLKDEIEPAGTGNGKASQ